MTREVQINKSSLGRRRLSYQCPNCGDRLRSSSKDAGKSDICPNCNVQFIVPGARQLNLLLEQEQHERHRKQAEKENKRREKQLQRESVRREHAQKKAEQDVHAQVEPGNNLPPPLPPDHSEQETSEFASINDTNDSLATERSTNWLVLTVVATLVMVAIFGIISGIYSASTKTGADITEVVRSAGLRTTLKTCDSHGVVNADVYYDGLLASNTVVFDLLDGGESGARRIDPVHLLLQFCAKIDLGSLETIVLARNGEQIFQIDSAEMQPLADSYDNDGIIWAFNNLPQSCKSMPGQRAYPEWTGGWLGVAQKQAEDLNDFIEAWTGL